MNNEQLRVLMTSWLEYEADRNMLVLVLLSLPKQIDIFNLKKTPALRVIRFGTKAVESVVGVALKREAFLPELINEDGRLKSGYLPFDFKSKNML